MMKPSLLAKLVLLTALYFLGCPSSSRAYSILSHEAIIDATWETSILPLLKQRFPGETDEQIKVAHAYAYGGAVAPDMGYFPFGSHLFTNLVHYVRSGDFVNALLEDARDINEYAFALGFMSHYMADKYGHQLGINHCVPIVYPDMLEKYGSIVTYEEDHVSHKRVEFAFDVLQTAKGNYASKTYHDFIGFQVSRPLLERAFRKIYGLDINIVFKHLSFAIEMFRWSVMSLFPVLTRTAWVIKKNEIRKIEPTATSRSFMNKMNRANYYQELGKRHRQPGFFVHVLSWVIRVLPKLGPLKTLKIKEPGPEAEKLFIQSFDTVLLQYNLSMKTIGSGNTHLENIDYDTGKETAPGEYKLADLNYGLLLLKLNYKHAIVSPDLRQNILAFYSDPTGIINREDPRQWRKITRALAQLKDNR